MEIAPLGQQASSTFAILVLRWHFTGLPPLSPDSLADGLLLLLCLIKYFVDPVGFEPTTFSMPLRRAPNCAMGPILVAEIVSTSQWTWRDSNPRPLQCD